MSRTGNGLPVRAASERGTIGHGFASR